VDCWCRLAGNVLHHTYLLEYQICSSQPRQKSCWVSVHFPPIPHKQLPAPVRPPLLPTGSGNLFVSKQSRRLLILVSGGYLDLET
jgi:hypothetical protein